MLKKGKDRLLARAAQNRIHVFAGSYRAATAREQWATAVFSILPMRRNTVQPALGREEF